MLAGGERDRFERLYRELRNDVLDGELAHGLARLAFADHILSVLSLSFSREIDPAKTAQAYFQLARISTSQCWKKRFNDRRR